jgi:hypothetical protein
MPETKVSVEAYVRNDGCPPYTATLFYDSRPVKSKRCDTYEDAELVAHSWINTEAANA